MSNHTTTHVPRIFTVPERLSLRAGTPDVNPQMRQEVLQYAETLPVFSQERFEIIAMCTTDASVMSHIASAGRLGGNRAGTNIAMIRDVYIAEARRRNLA